MTRIEMDTSIEDGIGVVACRGELDMAGTPALDDALAGLAGDPGVVAVVVDLSGLDFIDSSGLRAVVLADQQVRAQGRRFALVPGGHPVHRVFEITRMADRLSWVDSPGDLQPDAGEPA
jgi:anti-anti-sigma factor